jgi:hypothetical protein
VSETSEKMPSFLATDFGAKLAKISVPPMVPPFPRGFGGQRIHPELKKNPELCRIKRNHYFFVCLIQVRASQKGAFCQLDRQHHLEVAQNFLGK